MWIGLRHTSSSDLATTILVACAVLFSVAFAVYTAFRTGKFSTRPQWWLASATDKKYRSSKQTPKHL
jgi:flagellar basal body-associated protein FliL